MYSPVLGSLNLLCLAYSFSRFPEDSLLCLLRWLLRYHLHFESGWASYAEVTNKSLMSIASQQRFICPHAACPLGLAGVLCSLGRFGTQADGGSVEHRFHDHCSRVGPWRSISLSQAGLNEWLDLTGSRDVQFYLIFRRQRAENTCSTSPVTPTSQGSWLS